MIRRLRERFYFYHKGTKDTKEYKNLFSLCTSCLCVKKIRIQPRRRAPSGLIEVPDGGLASDFGAAGHAEFFADVIAMVLDGIRAHVQLLGDLFDRHPLADQREH